MERSAELDTLRERCVAVERQVEGLEALGARLARSRAAGRAADQRRARRSIGSRARMGDLGHKVESALSLRDDVERVLSLEGPVSALRSEAEALRGQIAEMSEGVGRIRAPARRRADRPPPDHLPARGDRPGAPGRDRPAGGDRAPAPGRRALARSAHPGHRVDSRACSTSSPSSSRSPTTWPRRPRRSSSSARRWTARPARSASSPSWTASSTPGSGGRRSRSAASARSRPRSPTCRRCTSR